MKSNTYIVIRDMSAGNDSVGEMWQETKIFTSDSTLDEVMRWALDERIYPKDFPKHHSSKRITITRPHEDKDNG